ncbi:GNAT family N-acetyltransferase [Streptomyces sp. NPDC050844]|uniref:GNAT family N-acetyltransferase n=1 Tax=Streptomyces sp. NPDC050844 TaxID=3155790 RepID=UPI0033D4066B
MTTAELVLPLRARDLRPADLPSCTWSGSPHHLQSVTRQLHRARIGEVDYLAICPPSDIPVAKGGIDYKPREGAGYLWQLAVHHALQSCGIGTYLIEAAEHRIRARGLHRAELAVEETNPRALALYERLGYIAYDRALDSWTEQSPDGSTYVHETMCVQLRKAL